MRKIYILLLVSFSLVIVSAAHVYADDSIDPAYSQNYSDHITGDNSFTADDGYRYWDIETGADSYQNEYYERPTVQTYEVRALSDGSEKFGANEYFSNLDIVGAKSGYDSQYMYFAIEMNGRHKHTSDGSNILEGLVYEYGIRFSSDADGRDGFLLTVDQPELKHGTTFGLTSNYTYKDTNGDVGGLGAVVGSNPSGINITKEDNPFEESNGKLDMDGYDDIVVADGLKKEGPSKDSEVLWTRVDPDNDHVVEFAFDYVAYGLDATYPENMQYLDFQAIKGDPKDPKNYFWNDKYDKGEAGSPYRALFGDQTKSEFGTQGLGNIYELDTLRTNVVPEPVSSILFLLGGGVIFFRKRFGRK